MKFKSITIKNFQSIKDLTIDFKEKGIFRFTGFNNTGKSAFLKAMTTLMRNVSNNTYKRFLRDEEDTFEISMVDFKGNKVKLSRGAVDFYEWTIDGKEDRVDKTQGRVPIEIQNYFNLYVEEEKTKECLNIRLPREVLLFVDTSAGDNAMMLQKALGTEEYMLAIKKVDKRGREINKEAKIVEKYLEKEVDKLDTVKKDLISREYKLGEIERYEKTLRNDYEELQEISELVEITTEYTKKSKEIKKKKDILKALEVDEVAEKLEELQLITNLVVKMEEADESEKKLEKRKKILEDIDFEGIKEKLEINKEINRVIELAEDKARSERIVKQRTKKLEEIGKELEDFREKLDVCPVCKTELTAGHSH